MRVFQKVNVNVAPYPYVADNIVALGDYNLTSARFKALVNGTLNVFALICACARNGAEIQNRKFTFLHIFFLCPFLSDLIIKLRAI